MLILEEMKKRSLWNRCYEKLSLWVDRPGFNPLICFIAAADLFIFIVPLEGMLIALVLLRPKRWLSLATWVAMGSMLGSVALALATSWFGNFMAGSSNETWKRCVELFQQWGTWALGGIAFSPIPLQPAVVIAAIAHVALWQVAVSVGLARVIKYGIYAWIASHAPALLKKTPKAE